MVRRDAVAEQYDARNAGFDRDTYEVANLDGRGMRALLNHQYRLRDVAAHFVSNPLLE